MNGLEPVTDIGIESKPKINVYYTCGDEYELAEELLEVGRWEMHQRCVSEGELVRM